MLDSGTGINALTGFRRTTVVSQTHPGGNSFLSKITRVQLDLKKSLQISFQTFAVSNVGVTRPPPVHCVQLGGQFRNR